VGKPGGDAMPGTPGNANISFTGGNDGVAVVGEALSASRRLGDALGATGGGTAPGTAPESISVGGEVVAVLP
jgi:hypothetical protein